MARFDLHPNPDPDDRIDTPFVLDVQNDHLASLDTRVVIPLRTTRLMPRAASSLNPVLLVAGRKLVLDTASLAPVPLSMLTKPQSLDTEARLSVLDALDTLFGSY